MKSTQFFAFVAGACMALGAFADAANTLITFSTPGPDTYADGKTVLDGEVYALVWSADGVFEGFTAEGEAAGEGDRVFFKAALAKDGHCPLTLFQIDSKVAPQGGQYAVYLLDTRAGNGLVTGAALAKAYGGTAGTSNIAATSDDRTIDDTGKAVALATDASGLAGDAAALAPVAPVIRGIVVNGAQVTISVGNLVPGLKYSVMGGLDRQAVVKSVGFQDAKEANIVLESSEKFFSVKAE